MKWRFLNTNSSSAAFNMAADGFLFDSYRETKQPIFRLYRWHKPCISLGRNQKHSDALELNRCIADHLELVKRPTGGQAIYHLPEELSYSLVASLDDINASARIKDSYKKICSVLIELYSRLGLKANFASEIEAKLSSLTADQMNLCFASWEADDIIIENKKIGGNAQRRSRNIVLQHGSIPLSFSSDDVKNYVKGIPDDIDMRTVALNDLLDENINVDFLEKLFFDILLERFDIELSTLSKSELKEIERRMYETRLA